MSYPACPLCRRPDAVARGCECGKEEDAINDSLKDAWDEGGRGRDIGPCPVEFKNGRLIRKKERKQAKKATRSERKKT